MKRAFHVIICLIVLIGCMVLVACNTYAADVVASGTCGGEGDGTNLTWTLDSDGVLTISGIGAMANYTSSKSPFYSYRGSITSVVIGDSVTSIGSDAFYNCQKITDTTIPDSVTRIGTSAFYGCLSLTNITIGKDVTSIGNSAFYGCTGLTEINYNAKSVADFSFDSNVFYNAGMSGDGITVVFGDFVETIPAYMFCTDSTLHSPNVTSITIGNNVTDIGDFAFAYCKRITKINYNARNMADFSKDSKRFLYAGVASEGITVVFGDSVETIPAYLFYVSYNFPNVTSITIGKNVTSIGANAFYNLTGLTEINYNAINVTSFGDAFDYGTSGDGITINLGDVVEVIPDAITNVRASSFNVDTGNRFYKSFDGILYNKNGKQLIRCPKLKFGSVVIMESVKVINDCAFSNCSKLTDIAIPDSVMSIGDSAFYGCTGLTSITIPEGITSIGDSAFYGCTGLTSITIPEGISSIGDSAFYKCTGLTGIMIPDSVLSIGDSAFYNCTGLTSITIPEGITSIGSSAFYSCTGLTEINYKARTVTSFSSKVFHKAGTTGDGIAVVFGDTVEIIPAGLFSASESDSPNITSITIGENVLSIGENAFNNCTKLTEINYNARNVADLDYRATVFCSAGWTGEGITITFGKMVKHIPDNLFFCYFYGDQALGRHRPNIKNVIFLGDRPSYGSYSFHYNTFYGYYPYGNSTWDIKPTLGSYNTITWSAFSLGNPVSADVAQMPYILEYEKDSEIDLTGLSLDVTFTDGCIERHGLSDIDVISYDLSSPGRCPVTVAYKGVQTTFYVTVYEYAETLIDSSLYPESPHPYDNDMDQTYTFSYPGATKIVFTFSEDTFVEDPVDKLYVYDNSGNLIAEYTRNEAAGKTITVDGDSFSIKLTSDESYTEYGFSIDSIVVITRIGTCENGHTLVGDIEYVWAEDFGSVSAGYMCKYCGELQAIETVQTKSVCTATCTEPGITTYTAVFTSAGLVEQTKSVETPALGHDFGGWLVTTQSTCTEAGVDTRYCNRCDVTETREIAALGHDWGDPTYTWADDNGTVTASRTCSHDSTHIEAETAAATLTVTSAATCVQTGAGYYSASFENIAFEPQTIEIVIPLADHTPGEPVHEHETESTYTEEGGYDLVVYCTVCSAELSREHVNTGLLIDNPVISSLTNGDTNSGITVNWTTQTNYSKFRIQRKATGESKWTTITSAATGTSYVDKTAKTGGATYTYRIAGYANGSWTDYSESVSLIRNPFTDVKTSASYFKALCWAYNNGIVAGTSTTKFSPNDNCTRGQFALMLWRMNGKPSTAGLENPFTDVKSSNGFYNGIVWCYNKGITAGTSATTFSPNNNITRWQMILMFWRMQGKPKSTLTENPFTDVKTTASYYKAALWAYENKITAVEKFMPNDLCTRWQLVLFLYRLNNLYHYI